MLNCMATYRRRDKKLVDNKLDAAGIADIYGKGDAIGNVIDMGSVTRGLGTSCQAAVAFDLYDQPAVKAALRNVDLANQALQSFGENFAALHGNMH